MSFADDFFGPQFVEGFLQGKMPPFEAFRKLGIEPDENETTLTLKGHVLRTEAGAVAMKALTLTGTEYSLVQSKNEVVPGSPAIILNSMSPVWEGDAATMRGNLYNRPPIKDGAEKSTNVVAMFQLSWDELFIPTKYETKGDEVTAVRGRVVRRKPGSDFIV